MHTAWLSLMLLAGPPIDPAALEQHLDELLGHRLEQTGVPGVVVSVVEGERVVLAKGWGQADIERDIPMDPERTVVRIASLSKTFTATAVAQLEDQGRLQLDAPVSEYLPGLQISGRFERPVTLRHVLGHTAGLINNNVGRVSTTAPAEGLGSFLERTMPPALRPPGVAVVYCNHGNALAGWVVERVGGQPFADYVAANILGPLDMETSSFVLEPRIEEALATGYTLEGGVAEPYEYLHFKTMPASTMHSTARDMANYMVMHLQGGRFKGRVVLPPDAAARMRSAAWGVHPALPTYHYAFAHAHTAGHATRSHGGSVPAFLSKVVLFDEHGVGVFVAQNSLGESLTGEVVESIAKRFLPTPSWPAVVAAGDGRPEDPSQLIGDYRRLGKGDTPAFTRGRTLLLQSRLRVGIDDEGFVVVGGDRFVRTGEEVFHRDRPGREPEALVFVRDPSGRVQWVHRGLASAERSPWHAARWVHMPWVGLALLVLVVAAVRGRGRAGVWPWPTIAAAWLAGVALLVPHLYVLWVDAGQVAYLKPLRFGMPAWVSVVSWGTPVAAGLAWVGVVMAARGRAKGRGVLRAALVVALAASALPLWNWYWSTPPPGLVRSGDGTGA